MHGVASSVSHRPSAAGKGAVLTPEEEKKVTAGLARAVDLLCQASGIATWTAENVCPKLAGHRLLEKTHQELLCRVGDV